MMNDPTHSMLDLIELSEDLGLEASDSYTAKYFLKHKEYVLAFEILVMRIHEAGVLVTDELYSQIVHTARVVEVPAETYDFLHSSLLKTPIPPA